MNKLPQNMMYESENKPPNYSRFTKKPPFARYTEQSKNISFVKLVHTNNSPKKLSSKIDNTKQQPVLMKVKKPEHGLYNTTEERFQSNGSNEPPSADAGDSRENQPTKLSSGDNQTQTFENKAGSMETKSDESTDIVDDSPRDAPSEFGGQKNSLRVRYQKYMESRKDSTLLEKIRIESFLLANKINWILSIIDNHLAVVITLFLMSFVLYPGFMVLFVPIFILLMYLFQPKEEITSSQNNATSE